MHHSGQSVYLIEEGSLLVRTQKGTIRSGPGCWVLPTPGERYQKFSDNARILSLHFQLHWPGGQPLFSWDVAATWKKSETPPFEMRSKRLQRLVAREFPGVRSDLSIRPSTLANNLLLREHFFSWLRCYVDTLLSLGFVPSRLSRMDERLLHVVQVLDRMAFQVPYRERELAREINLSVSQLDRLFVKQFEITPRRYLEKRKLERAMTAMQTAASIKEVAFDLGFGSLPHFSGWFRQKTGVSPREFRKTRPVFGRI